MPTWRSPTLACSALCPSYTLVDLGLSWKINRSLTLVGRVRNATDRIYAANLGSTFAYLGAPRTGDLSLHVAF